MAASAPLGPKDYISNLPPELKLAIGKMAPELLTKGKLTNKALNQFLKRNEVWLQVAQTMNIPISNRAKAQEELTDAVKRVNEILFDNLPEETDPMTKAGEVFEKNAKLNGYIAAHSKEKPVIDSFAKFMDTFSKRMVYRGPSLRATVNALKAYIKDGVLQNPDLPWKKFLMQALWQEYSGEKRLGGNKKQLTEIFDLLLKEYIKNNPNDPNKKELLDELCKVILEQNNFQAFESLIANGYKVSEEMMIHYMMQIKDELIYPAKDLPIALMTHMILKNLNKKECLIRLEQVEKNAPLQHLLGEINNFREVINRESLLLDGTHFYEETKEMLKDWFSKARFDSNSDLHILAKYCSPQDKVLILKLLDEWETETAKTIETKDEPDFRKSCVPLKLLFKTNGVNDKVSS